MSNIRCTVKRDVLVINFSIENLSNVEDVTATGAQLLAMTCQTPNNRMLLDFRGVAFLNSAMVGQLFVLSKRCKNDGIIVRLCNLNPTIRQVLEIVGLHTLIPIIDDEEDPLEAFEKIESAVSNYETVELVNMEELTTKAEAGDVAAMIELGESLENGTGGTYDVDESVKWYHKAAVQGDCIGQYKTGMAYAFGIGVDANWSTAMKWYQLAADQGHAEAEYAVGMIHCYGLAGEADKPKAAKWYKRSLANGYRRAEQELARLEA